MVKTLQETFDKVAKHLLEQMEKSEDEGRCLYRGSNGKKCAIGCLIPDKFYNPSLEGKLITHNDILETLHQGGYSGDKMFLLMSDLQKVHDFVIASNWQRELKVIASRYILSDKVLYQSKGGKNG